MSQVIETILQEMGILEYEANIIISLCDFVTKYATEILKEAQTVASNSQNLTPEDVKCAVNYVFDAPILQFEDIDVFAQEINKYPLQQISRKFGLNLPPERYCLASKLGIVEILSSLDDDTVLALAATVTQGLLKNAITSRQEAENAILNYSTDATSFLRRRIITKDILFAYVHRKNISVNLPASKSELIYKITELWNNNTNPEFAANVTDCGSIALLAAKFTEWYYTMLNKKEYISQEHFFQDSKFVVNTYINGSITSELVENDPQQIVHKLFFITNQYNLFFNPNLSGDGVQGRVEPHGLVLVFVCGTLHIQDACVGIFEQVFGLVRDPLSDNNWKIKQSELTMKNQDGATNFGNPNLLSLKG